MSHISRYFSPFLKIFLTLLLVLSLTGCAQLEEVIPSDAAQAVQLLQTLPEKLDHLAQQAHRLAGELEELSNDLARWLDRLLDDLLRGTPPEVGENSTFAVHFLDVGQADSALVECDGQYMLIDGGNREDSDLIYAYLSEQKVERLEYLVATHLHEDHIGGLSAAPYAAEVGAALAPETDGTTKVFKNLVKALDSRGLELTVPAPGDTFPLGSAHVTVLGPLEDYRDTNDTSLVLSVQYGATTFLFTGDMERTAEADLVEAGLDLSATVLKVGHHGSESSTSYPFLRSVMPQYAVISVGAGNEYGHPTEAVLSRLADAEVTVYRTDQSGTVIAVSDGTDVTFTTEK